MTVNSPETVCPMCGEPSDTGAACYGCIMIDRHAKELGVTVEEARRRVDESVKHQREKNAAPSENAPASEIPF